MDDISDRLMILLIAATGLIVLLVGWEWALVQGIEMQLSRWMELVLYAAISIVFVLVVVAVWFETRQVDKSRD
jgi:hypothetical protein